MQIVSRALSVLVAILLARLLTVEQFGLYNYILSIVTVLSIPVMAGISRFLMREISTLQSDGLYKEIKSLIIFFLFYILISSSFVGSLTYIVTYFDFISYKISYLLLFAIFLIPIRGLLTLLSSIFNSLSYPVLGQLPLLILVPFIQLGFICILHLYEVDFSDTLMIGVIISSSLVSLIISTILVAKVLPRGVFCRGIQYNIKSWLLTLLPFTLLNVVTTLNIEFASLVLGYYVDESSVGLFKVALRAVGLISLFLQAINIVIGPRIAIYYKKNKNKELNYLVQKSVCLSLILSLPIILLLFSYSSDIIEFLFGVEYKEAAIPLSIMCFGQIINVVFGPVDLILNMTKNEKTTLKVVFVSAFSNILLLVVFVPLFGIIGAAYATVCSIVITKGTMAFLVYKKLNIKSWPSINVIKNMMSI